MAWSFNFIMNVSSVPKETLCFWTWRFYWKFRGISTVTTLSVRVVGKSTLFWQQYPCCPCQWEPVSKGWCKVSPILLLYPSLSSAGLLESLGSLQQQQQEKPQCSCSSQEHLRHRWPWLPKIVMRPSFMYVLVFGKNHFTPHLNPSNLSWQLCHLIHCIKFLCMKCWEWVFRFSWLIPDWYFVKCPLKI